MFTTVVFDFDYTLADSSSGIIHCIGYALGRLGLPAVSPASVRATIGLHLGAAFQRLAGAAHESRTDEFLRLFAERARAVMVDGTVILEGVPETIAGLRARGIRLGIASTKTRRYIEGALERHGLRDSFDVIIGGDDVARPKPDPAGLLEVVRRITAARARPLYVGDSVVDAETAQRAGVPFVAVLSGVTARDEFAGYDVHAIVERLSELPGLLGPPGSSSAFKPRQSSSTSRS